MYINTQENTAGNWLQRLRRLNKKVEKQKDLDSLGNLYDSPVNDLLGLPRIDKNDDYVTDDRIDAAQADTPVPMQKLAKLNRAENQQKLDNLGSLYDSPVNDLLGLPRVDQNLDYVTQDRPDAIDVALPTASSSRVDIKKILNPNKTPATPSEIVKKITESNKVTSKMSTAPSVQPSTNSNTYIPEEELKDTEFETATEKARGNRFSAMMNDITSKLGSSIANVNSTSSTPLENPFESVNRELIKGADRPLDELQAKRASFQQLLKETTDKESRDPNSPASVAARELMKEFGTPVPDTATAAQLENTLALAKEKYRIKTDRQDRMEQRAERALARKEMLDAKMSTVSDKSQQEAMRVLEKRREKFDKDPALERYKTLKEAANRLQDAILNGSQMEKGAAAALYGKVVQYDSSAIRESDIQFIMGKFGLTPSAASNAINKLVTGDTLTKKEAQIAREIALRQLSREFGQLKAKEERLIDQYGRSKGLDDDTISLYKTTDIDPNDQKIVDRQEIKNAYYKQYKKILTDEQADAQLEYMKKKKEAESEE